MVSNIKFYIIPFRYCLKIRYNCIKRFISREPKEILRLSASCSSFGWRPVHSPCGHAPLQESMHALSHESMRTGQARRLLTNTIAIEAAFTQAEWQKQWVELNLSF